MFQKKNCINKFLRSTSLGVQQKSVTHRIFVMLNIFLNHCIISTTAIYPYSILTITSANLLLLLLLLCLLLISPQPILSSKSISFDDLCMRRCGNVGVGVVVYLFINFAAQIKNLGHYVFCSLSSVLRFTVIILSF